MPEQQNQIQNFNQYDQQNDNIVNSESILKKEESFSSSSPQNINSKRSKRFKKIACTECRQQKAKCDASDKQPGPCTRCSKRQIPCRLDCDFKRTFKRAKIDELVKEYEIIKSKLQMNPELIIGKDKSIIASPIQQQFSPNLQTMQKFPNYLSTNNDTNIITNNMKTNSNTNTNNNNSNSNDNNNHSNNNSNLINGININNINNRNSSNSSSPLPDPNIFYPSINNNFMNMSTSPLAMNCQSGSRNLIPNTSNTSFKSNSPLSLMNRNQYSPLPILNRSNSPLNPEMNVQMQISSNNASSANNNFIQPQPTSIGPNLDLSHSNSISNSNSISHNNSAFNLTTLISAANVSDQKGIYNQNQNYINLDSNKAINLKRENTGSINNQLNDVSVWKIEPRAVRKPKIDNSLLKCTPKSLGDITLAENQVVVLYSTFLTYYHPLLPVIDIEKSIETIYRLCPALFWTIMFTALRGQHSLSPVISQSDCQMLYFKLSPILKSILAEITISPITRYAPSEVDEPILNASSVYSVQAFLIYTFWPPLTSSLSADSSWNTIGIAFYQAIRIGLHTPGLTSDRLKSTNKDLLNEQIRTWIACNIVSQTIASVFGFPGFFQPFGSLSLSLSLKGNEIPHCLRQMLEIQTFEEQVEKTLNNNSFDPLRSNQSSERLPMIQLLENELNQLELRLCLNQEFPIDDFRVLTLYSSRLHLLCYNFLDNEKEPSFELKRGFIKTYNAALAIIEHCKESHERNSLFVKNLPSAYILTIWQASVVIARLINSSYQALLNREAGKKLYQTAIDLVMKASIVKHDLPYRSCGIMKSTWNLFKTLSAADPDSLKLTVKSRMSVNLFFDTLWTLREKCGMIKLQPNKEKIQSTDSDSDAEEIENENDNCGEKQSEEALNEGMGKDNIINTENESRSASKDNDISLKKKSHYHPETAARRIISTIPLDPQPIALTETPQDSSSSSKQGSPYLSNYKSPTNTVESTVRKIITPQSLANASTSHYQSSPESRANGSTTNNTPAESKKVELTNMFGGIKSSFETTLTANNKSNINDMYLGNISTTPNFIASGIKEDLPPGTTESWEIGNELDTDMLFKDIESVMNEFGFHGDY
jgi:transcriptional regulatory protein LEU3